MDLETFAYESIKASNNYPELRHGQVLFRVLESYDKDLADQIRGSPADPFHAESPFDERIALFWAKVVARS